MLNATRISFPPLPPTCLILLPHPVLYHVLSMFLPFCSFYSHVCTVCFHGFPSIGYILSWLIRFALFKLLFVCAWLGWPISLTYQYLSVSQVVVFLRSITQVVLIANTLVYHVALLPLFDHAKRRKIGITMVILVWLGLSWFLQNFSLLWLDCFGTN